LTAQNQPDGPWKGKSNEEQCDILEKLGSNCKIERIPFKVSPEMIQKVKNSIKESHKSKTKLESLDKEQTLPNNNLTEKQ
jgi:hypothetical protein